MVGVKRTYNIDEVRDGKIPEEKIPEKKAPDNNKFNDEYIKSLGLDPQDLVKDYINWRGLSMGPKVRMELEKLISESREDVRNLAKIIRNFDSF